MCRLFGAIGNGPVAYDLFEEFADLAVTGNTPSGGPDERGHQDGWGLAFFHDGKLEQHARGPGSAQGDPKYAQAAWRIAKVNAESARKVPVGEQELSGRDIADQFGVHQFPMTWFLKPDGGRIANIPGFIPPERFVKALEFVHERRYAKTENDPQTKQ